MTEQEPEIVQHPRGRFPRRARGRIGTGIALGIMLGGGAFLTGSGTAGASDAKPVLSQDLQVTTPTSAASSAASSTATSAGASASSSARAEAKPKAEAKTGTQASTKAAAAAKPAATTAPATVKPVAAPPLTSTGQSITLAAAQQPSQVGAIFSGSIADGHHCTASVVDSPAGDLIVTAAHCLSSGGADGTSFVPDYRDGTAPYGVWQVSQVLEDDAWTSSQDPDHDVAFAVVAPLNGKSLESVVGSYNLDTSGVTDAQVQITGYPESTDEPISCTGSSQTFTDTQLTVDCTGYADGTSGSGWVENYDPGNGTGTLVGVIGGYETGGDSDDVSYTALFGTSVETLYQQAMAAG